MGVVTGDPCIPHGTAIAGFAIQPVHPATAGAETAGIHQGQDLLHTAFKLPVSVKTQVGRLVHRESTLKTKSPWEGNSSFRGIFNDFRCQISDFGYWPFHVQKDPCADPYLSYRET
jgi:hypothetical protein